MIYTVDPSFQRRIDEWNASKGGPAYIALSWNPQKERWQVFAIPMDISSHPLARNDHTLKHMRDFPDGSGRRGVFLNTWQGAKGEFLPLDERLFEALHFADSFRDKQHFEKAIEEPEARAQMEINKKVRDVAAAAREYWWSLSKIVSTSVTGGWRSKLPWS